MVQVLEVNVGLILVGNVCDFVVVCVKGVGSVMFDCLVLDLLCLFVMVEVVCEVVGLLDFVGEVICDDVCLNGICVQKVCVLLGVIVMIYEVCLNVIVEVVVLCLKVGNGVILCGGFEVIYFNIVIVQVFVGVLKVNGVLLVVVIVLIDLCCEVMLELLQLYELIDLVILCGGEGLICFVVEYVWVLVIKYYKGVCYLFVDVSVDLGKVIDLLVDGKCSWLVVCNLLEILLVYCDVVDLFLLCVVQVFGQCGVQLCVDVQVQLLLLGSMVVIEEDYVVEFFDFVLVVCVVDDFDVVIVYICCYIFDYIEVIVIVDVGYVECFVIVLCLVVVMVNVLLCFFDGGQLGLGSEIGIFIMCLYVYGLMGLEVFIVECFVVCGEGQMCI